jgi:hypothetical protein
LNRVTRADESVTRLLGKRFECQVGILEVIENAEEERQFVAICRQLELRVQIDLENLDAGIEVLLQQAHPAAVVEIGGRKIRDVRSIAERFEEKCEVAIGSADIDDQAVADAREEVAVVAGEQVTQHMEDVQRSVWIPAEFARCQCSLLLYQRTAKTLGLHVN